MEMLWKTRRRWHPTRCKHISKTTRSTLAKLTPCGCPVAPGGIWLLGRCANLFIYLYITMLQFKDRRYARGKCSRPRLEIQLWTKRLQGSSFSLSSFSVGRLIPVISDFFWEGASRPSVVNHSIITLVIYFFVILTAPYKRATIPKA